MALSSQRTLSETDIAVRGRRPPSISDSDVSHNQTQQQQQPQQPRRRPSNNNDSGVDNSQTQQQQQQRSRSSNNDFVGNHSQTQGSGTEDDDVPTEDLTLPHGESRNLLFLI